QSHTHRRKYSCDNAAHGHHLLRLPGCPPKTWTKAARQSGSLGVSGLPKVAVLHSILVKVKPDDLPRWVNAKDPRAQHSSIWIVPRADFAIGSAQEACPLVRTNGGTAKKVTRDRSRRIDGRGAAKSRKHRSVKAAEDTVGRAKKDSNIRVLGGVIVES